MRDDGVRYYTPALLSYEFGFPEDKTVCQWCPFCYASGELKRYVCRITGEFLPYPFTSRGMKCPVAIIDVGGE